MGKERDFERIGVEEVQEYTNEPGQEPHEALGDKFFLILISDDGQDQKKKQLQKIINNIPFFLGLKEEVFYILEDVITRWFRPVHRELCLALLIDNIYCFEEDNYTAIYGLLRDTIYDVSTRAVSLEPLVSIEMKRRALDFLFSHLERFIELGVSEIDIWSDLLFEQKLLHIDKKEYILNHIIKKLNSDQFNQEQGREVYQLLVNIMGMMKSFYGSEIQIIALRMLLGNLESFVNSGIQKLDILQEFLINQNLNIDRLNTMEGRIKCLLIRNAYEQAEISSGLLRIIHFCSDMQMKKAALQIFVDNQDLESLESIESSVEDAQIQAICYLALVSLNGLMEDEYRLDEVSDRIHEIVCNDELDIETRKVALQIFIDNGAIDEIQLIAFQEDVEAELRVRAINGMLSIETMTKQEREEILKKVREKSLFSDSIEMRAQALRILMDSESGADCVELPGETGHDEESGSDDDEAVITDGGMDTKSDSGQSDAEIGQDTSGDGGDAPGGSGAAVSFIATGPAILDLVDTNGIDIAEALSANKDYVSSEESKKAIMSFIETGYESANVTIPEGTNHPVLEYIYKGSMAGLLILPDVSAVDHTVAGNIMESNYTVAITH